MLLLACAFCTQCGATVVEYNNNRAAWLAAAGSFTRLGFTGLPEGTLVATQFASDGVAFTDGVDVTEQNNSFLNDGWGLSGAFDEITIAFSLPMHAIAVDFVSRASFRLYLNGQLTYTSSNFVGGAGSFAGLISDRPFDAAVIYDPTGGVFIDDLYFGPPFVGSVPVKPVMRIAHAGQTLGHRNQPFTILSLGAPTINSLGQVGFNGTTTTPGETFVWFNGQVVFLSSDVRRATVIGRETVMGVSDTGAFVYSPQYNGRDSIYTSEGRLLALDDPLPPLPGLFSVVSNYWPSMSGDGTAYWISRFAPMPGVAETGRAIMRCQDLANPASMTRIIASGDVLDGFPVRANTGPSYDVSPDGQHLLYYIAVDDPNGSSRLVLDGQVVARGSQPPPGFTEWQFYYDLAVNNLGDYVYRAYSGSGKESIACNGQVVATSGDVIDNLGLGASVLGNALNNHGQLASAWRLAPDSSAVFFGRADDLAHAACLLRVGDMIDYSGDAVADAGIAGINTATGGSQLALSDSGDVYLEVSLLDVGSNTPYEAILRLDSFALGHCPADIAGPPAAGGSVNTDDLIAVILGWGECPQPCPPRCRADITGDCAVNTDDLLRIILSWGPCPSP